MKIKRKIIRILRRTPLKKIYLKDGLRKLIKKLKRNQKIQGVARVKVVANGVRKNSL